MNCLALLTEAITLELIWVPSHCTEETEKYKYRPTLAAVIYDFTENKIADYAAKRFELPLNVTKPILYHMSLVTTLQKRIVTIPLALPNGESRARRGGC